MRTRSWDALREGAVRKGPPKTVPATVKMLKLLLNEYTHIQELKVSPLWIFQHSNILTSLNILP